MRISGEPSPMLTTAASWTSRDKTKKVDTPYIFNDMGRSSSFLARFLKSENVLVITSTFEHVEKRNSNVKNCKQYTSIIQLK